MDQIFGMAIALGRFHCASKNPGRKLSKTFKVNIEPKYCSPKYQHFFYKLLIYYSKPYKLPAKKLNLLKLSLFNIVAIMHKVARHTVLLIYTIVSKKYQLQ
jgi:hypothetical protein